MAYWYALYPQHQLVFAGMLRGIVEAMPDGPIRGDAPPVVDGR